jgi:superfamily II DNA helicase RecQ
LQIGEAEIRVIPSTQQDYHIQRQYCIDGRNRGSIGLSNLPRQCRRPGRKSQTHEGIDEWESRVIAATNALGMGMDLPDIRVVIHAGQPRKLRDYAQESSQAGRDRENSEANIVYGRVEKVQPRQRSKSWAQSTGEDIADFVAGYNCRRIIMDRIMDGRMGMHKQQHRLEDCQEAEIAAVSQAIQTMTPEMQGKKRFEKFYRNYCGWIVAM